MQGTNAHGSRVSQMPIDAPTTLLDLLPPSITTPVIDVADESFLDNLLSQLPSDLLDSSRQNMLDLTTQANPGVFRAETEAWSLDQKRIVLRKVVRSPQFSQSLIGLTGALRDGGLPAISDALGIPVENGGYSQSGGLPMGGNDAIGAFVEGVKSEVEKDLAKRSQANPN